MEKIEFENLKKENISDVFELQKQFFGALDFSKIENALDSQIHFFYVAKINGEVIGYFECQVIAPEAELFEIAIKQEYQGKGYSKLLMQKFIDVCENQGVRTIFLEVNKINTIAKKLYDSFEFQEYSIRKNYYGKFDAILMKKDLS